MAVERAHGGARDGQPAGSHLCLRTISHQRSPSPAAAALPNSKPLHAGTTPRRSVRFSVIR